MHTWEAKSILINGVTLLLYSDVPVSEYLGIPYQEFTMELHCTLRYRFRFIDSNFAILYEAVA